MMTKNNIFQPLGHHCVISLTVGHKTSRQNHTNLARTPGPAMQKQPKMMLFFIDVTILIVFFSFSIICNWY